MGPAMVKAMRGANIALKSGLFDAYQSAAARFIEEAM
jgi:hypothetical protein